MRKRIPNRERDKNPPPSEKDRILRSSSLELTVAALIDLRWHLETKIFVRTHVSRAIRARDESSGSNVKRLFSYSRRYSENNGCCEQRYKRRAWFVVVVVVGCSPFSLQMISSADTCLFMSPSVPRIVDATSSKGTLTVRGMGQLYRLRSVRRCFLAI